MDPTAKIEGADRAVLLTGATGFVGNAALPALTEAGFDVRCASRDPEKASRRWPDRRWVRADVADRGAVERAAEGCDCAFYLVHGMASEGTDFRRAEIAQAESFLRAAESAGVRRIVYLGGVAGPRDASEHLRSRQEVGEVLRSGRVATVELRASMIIGHGSLSWLIVRDLAARLPFMVLPSWLESRTQPVAIDDVVAALLGAIDVPVPASEWFDVPGPDVLSGREILERTADVLGVGRPFMIEVPFVTPRLSSHWVRLVTRADWSVAREIVVGLKDDLLAKDDRFWGMIGHPDLLHFEEAARRALEAERLEGPIPGAWGAIERAILAARRGQA
ncbi:MAG: NAD(P)H-binding protein [Alphaproteobacteria bacterium]